MVTKTHAEGQARDFRRHTKVWEVKAGTMIWSCVCGDLLRNSKPKGWKCEHETGEWPTLDPISGIFKRKRTTDQTASDELDDIVEKRARKEPKDPSDQSSTSATVTEDHTRGLPSSSSGRDPDTSPDGPAMEAGEMREPFSTFTANGNPRSRSMPPIASARVRYIAAHQPVSWPERDSDHKS